MAIEKRQDRQQSRQYQITIARGSAFFLIVLLASMLVLLAGPVRNSLMQRRADEYLARVEMLFADAHGYFLNSRQIAAQLPSRTLIRQELVAYVRGTRTREWYIEFTRDKLRDAVVATADILAAFRFDQFGEALVGYGVTPEQLPPLRFEPTANFSAMHRAPDGTPAIVHVVPIVDAQAGTVGYDAVLVSLAALIGRLELASARLHGTALRVLYCKPGGPSLAVGAGESDSRELCDPACNSATDSLAEPGLLTSRTLSVAGVPTRAFTFFIAPGWAFVAGVAEHELFADTRRELLLYLVLTLVVGGLLVVANVLLVRTLSARTLQETEQLTQLVDKRTTALSAALEKNRLLLREVHHRIKNDMAIVRSMLSLQAAQSGVAETQESLRGADGLLAVMGRVYDKLYRSEEYGEVPIRPVMQGLLDDLGAGSGASRVRIDSEIDKLVLPRSVAVPIGIMTNELIVNAVKYAGRDDAIVTVALRGDGDASTSWTELVVSDNGPGFPEVVLRGEYGFGLSMVAAVAQQLGGTFGVDNVPGARIAIRVPMPNSKPLAN